MVQYHSSFVDTEHQYTGSYCVDQLVAETEDGGFEGVEFMGVDNSDIRVCAMRFLLLLFIIGGCNQNPNADHTQAKSIVQVLHNVLHQKYTLNKQNEDILFVQDRNKL
jgi:hypothetical protein